MKVFFFALLSAGASLFFGCAAVNRMAAGEPAALQDATPPPSYHPVYIHQIGPLTDASPAQKPKLEISWIDAREPNRVKIYAHLVDSTGTYLTGAAASKWKSHWCAIEDSDSHDWHDINKYGLKEMTEMQRVPTALALVMDHSGSMGEDRAHAIQEAAGNLIDKMLPGDALALIKYDGKVVVEAPLSTTPTELHAHLDKNGLEGFGGATAILDAVDTGISELQKARFFDRKAVVLFTDGQDNSSSVNRDTLLQLARKSNTLVCSVGFGEGIDEPYLLSITNPTGGFYRHVYGTGEINEVFEDLYKRLRNYYVIDYVPPSYGLHSAAITLCLPRDTLVAEGRYDNTPYIGSVALLDVNFDLNSSAVQDASMPAIDNVLTLLKAYPLMTIEVQGHTDNSNNTGDPDYNNKLSKKRAEAVKAALVKRGIRAERITTKGFGDSVPIADNQTEDGRAANRRTVFVIVAK